MIIRAGTINIYGSLEKLSALLPLCQNTLSSTMALGCLLRLVCARVCACSKSAPTLPTTFLRTPAHLLYRSVQAKPAVRKHADDALSAEFYEWIVDPERGQRVTLAFSKAGEVLYSKPPPSQY